MRRLLTAVACTLALGGCGGGASGPPDATATSSAATTPATAAATVPATAAVTATSATASASEQPAACGLLSVRVTGRLHAPAAIELSGLALSRTQPGLLWTHNDSGNAARILAVTPGGKLLAQVTVTKAENKDWEDIAIAGDTLYIADIGDNKAKRPSISVYQVAEPRVPASATAPATRLKLHYLDGPRNAEALLVDPADRTLVIVTKSPSGNSGIYVARRGAKTLRRAGAISLGTDELVTGASLSADGSTIVLRTYDRAYVWRRASGQSIAATLEHRPCTARVNLLGEGQGEAIALVAHGRAFYTVPEGHTPAIRLYRAR